MRGGGVCLLHWQVAVVSRSVQALGIGATACEVFLENNCEKKGGKCEYRIKFSTLCTLLTQFLRVSGILPTIALLTSLAAISRSSMAAASL